MAKKDLHINTQLVHEKASGTSGDAIVPIHVSTTFETGNKEGYEYARTGNPTRDVLEGKLAKIEGVDYAVCFSAGMSAIEAVMDTFLSININYAPPHIVASNDLYGGTIRSFRDKYEQRLGFKFTYVDTTNPQNIEKTINSSSGVDLIFIETPSNPLMKLCDIAAAAEIAKNNDILLVVDNTFAPLNQFSINLGADIAIHSTTKYINGHGTSLGGAAMTPNEEMYLRLKETQNTGGAVPSSEAAHKTYMGIRTLPIRMREHNKNGLVIANYLATHPQVEKVNYPGLKSHPQYELAKKQMDGFGGMISLEIKDDEKGLKATKFANHLELFLQAESLGTTESLVSIPAKTTHMTIPKEQRLQIGMKDSLVRLSVGIEHYSDLIDDLEQAFDYIK